MIEKSPSPKAPSGAQQWAALLAFPVLCIVVGFVSLPHPKPAKEARAAVKKEDVADVVMQQKPTPKIATSAVLGDQIRVLGADVPTGPVRPGESTTITFYYETVGEIARNWQAFVHIDLRGGSFRIHGDHYPARGRLSTSLWSKGDIIKDVYTKVVPLDAPAGTYDIFIGFYIGNDRLPFTGGEGHAGENRVRVGTLVVK